MIFNHHISAGYPRRTGNKQTYASDPGLVGIPCDIQPASPEYTAITDGAFGKTWTVFTTNSGVRDGAQVTVSGSDPFTSGIVKACAHYNGPLGRTFELVVREAE